MITFTISDLFNLRGDDIPFNPVFFSYAIVTENSAFLFIDEKKLNDEVLNYLKDGGVFVKPYDSCISHLKEV